LAKLWAIKYRVDFYETWCTIASLRMQWLPSFDFEFQTKQRRGFGQWCRIMISRWRRCILDVKKSLKVLFKRGFDSAYYRQYSKHGCGIEVES